MNKRLGRQFVFACAVALLPFAAGPSHALLIDPNFKVCPLGTTDTSLPVCNADPNSITTAGVTVGVEGNAGNGPLDPFLLLVAVPNQGTKASAPGLGDTT